MENSIATVSTQGQSFGTSIFSNVESFETAQRMAKLLASSTIVPKEYQATKENPNAISNALIAIEMSTRLGASPMMIMQNLYVVNGRPAWSSQYIIAMINSSKKYRMELQFEMKGKGDSLECYAWTEDQNGRKVIGPTITMEMANSEGWVNRNGSKWKTMPEVMMRYRAASFFGRLYCPDMIMGIYSADEVKDGIEPEPVTPNSVPLGFDEPEESIAVNADYEVDKAADQSTPASAAATDEEPGF